MTPVTEARPAADRGAAPVRRRPDLPVAGAAAPATGAAWFPYGAPPRDGRLPVFCLPYAGGGASVFRSWRDALGPRLAAVPVQLPGREGRHREPAVRDLPALTTALADVLEPWTAGGYALFGHSMGATLGYEVSAELAARGVPPPRTLFVSAACAPHIRLLRPDLHLLDDATFGAALRDLGGTPQSLLEDPESAAFYLPLMRADLELVSAGQRSPSRITLPAISAFGGLDDPAVGPADVLPWRDYAGTSFRSRMLPGDHFFLHPLRRAVLEAVAADLT